MKKKIIIVISGLIVAAAIAYPWYQLHNKDASATEQDKVTLSFMQTYGQGATLLGVQPVKDVDIVYWQTATKAYASLYLDGSWIQIASKDITAPETTPTPGP